MIKKTFNVKVEINIDLSITNIIPNNTSISSIYNNVPSQ